MVTIMKSSAVLLLILAILCLVGMAVSRPAEPKPYNSRLNDADRVHEEPVEFPGESYVPRPYDPTRLDKHAIQRHGMDAWNIWTGVKNGRCGPNGTPGTPKLWACGGGRAYLTCGNKGNLMGIVLLLLDWASGNYFAYTAYYATPTQVQGYLVSENCKEFFEQDRMLLVLDPGLVRMAPDLAAIDAITGTVTAPDGYEPPAEWRIP